MPDPWEGPVALAKPSKGLCACKKKDDDDDADGADGASCDAADASGGEGAGGPKDESRVFIDDGKTPQFPGEGQERWINDPKLATDNDRRLLEWTKENVPLPDKNVKDIDMFLEDMKNGTDRLWGPGESPALHPLPKDWTDPNGGIG